MEIPQKAWTWRTQTWLVLIAGLTAILIALVASYASSNFRPTVDVKVGQSGIYSLWVAQTNSELYQGLSGVDKLSRNGGLLMDFKVPGYHGIAMRGMLFPLDIIWLDESKKVVSIVRNNPVTAEDVMPTKPARYVLELTAGTSQDSAIKVGDKAEFILPGGV